MNATPFPGRNHPMNFVARSTARSRQPAMDLALVLEDIQMTPNTNFSMIVAERLALVVRTPVALPKVRRLTHFNGDQATA